ncbi:SPOR domain-containing protein [Sulfurimonas sp. MAG313]|nr:SPOR domain-containing protein [Sulfurimonas sp. MAG313]MDF1879832.1 SPOR domain-containing protein [Sulfurimonas sp. MAG313]
MKFSIIILILCMSVFADTRYAIQVISVKNSHSITQELIQKIKDTKISYTQDKSGGLYHIYMGSFSTWKDALSSLSMIRRKVSSDAFICKRTKGLRDISKHKMKKAKTRTLAKVNIKDIPIEKTIHIEDTSDCIQTHEELRESAISEALSFYKNSSYYTFNKE